MHVGGRIVAGKLGPVRTMTQILRITAYGGEPRLCKI